MRVLTISELLRLSRKELYELWAQATASLPQYPEGSTERATALMNLRNIRLALARQAPAP